MAADFKLCIVPAPVPVRRTEHMAELAVVGCLRVPDIRLKSRLQQSVLLPPVHGCIKVDPSGMRIQRHVLRDS